MNPYKFATFVVKMWRATQAIKQAKNEAQKTRAKASLCRAFDKLRADLAKQHA